MKLLSTIILSLIASVALANSRSDRLMSQSSNCEVQMTRLNGNTIDTFYGSDCRSTLNQCESRLERLQRRGRAPYATCKIINDRRGGRGDWEVVDEVHFNDSSTGRAILMCKSSRNADRRCNSRAYSCSECSEIAHSDHSSYLVYARERRAARRTYIDTFHYYDRQTAVAKQKCEAARGQMFECSRPRAYECTPCTTESHTDHSQFELYRID